jgi:CBS domain-containing protein
MRRVLGDLTAGDVMRVDVAAIPEDLPLRAAARLMAECGTCAVPVTDARGRCVGLLLASHVLRSVAGGDGTGSDAACYWTEWQMGSRDGASEVHRRMIAPPPVVATDAPLHKAARQLISLRAAVVVDRHHRPVGVLTPADVLAAAAAPPAEANGRAAPAHGETLGV